MSCKALLIFPAPDRIIKTFPLIIGKEITDICIVLKLLIDDSLPFFLIFQYLTVSLYSIGIGLSCVAFQPFLECHIERKRLAYLVLEKGSVLF